jgi:hypothetical protein
LTPRWLPASLLASLLALLGQLSVAQAALLRYCDPPAPLSATQNDRLLRIASLIRSELESSGQQLALIARSGLDLSRFGLRYSHAGLSLKGNPSNPWAIRQLYYDCDERKPRIFDQGISAFLLGLADSSAGFISVVLIAPEQAGALAAAALDNRQAVQLLNARYSANAHAFSVEYQNCNQWLAELMAVAWTQAKDLRTEIDEATLLAPAQARAQAQSWLKQRGYAPTVFEIAWRPLLWLGALIPWVHLDDHPADDLQNLRLHITMPASIEAFVRSRAPASTRIEFCHTEKYVVIRRGWTPIDEGCQPAERDTVVSLD